LEFTVTLEGGHSISGRVLDDLGASVPEATIHALDLSSGDSQQAQCDSEGNFTLSGLGTNPVHLAAHARGYLRSTTSAIVPNSKGIDIRLREGHMVTISIECASLPETVHYELSGPSTQWGASGLTDGRIKIEGVSAGEHQVKVKVPGYETLDQPSISVPPGPGSTDVRVRLRLL
jgi:hypothetical protein